ncbi:hypothetical protein VT85_05700 [Planctomyces sp. SH-PL62]|nr:hypothetical protein VT85_05700 [Planctomyces sp. SH-PL62]
MAIVEVGGENRSGWLQGFRELDLILRGDRTRPSALREGAVPISPVRLSRVIVLLCLAHGLCMGTFAMFSKNGPALDQVLATMVKVPLLFYLTLFVTLPSLYVFNALVGSRLTFSSVVRVLTATLGVNVAVLASLGPIVAFFSACTTSYPFMVLFNVVVFAVAGFLAQMYLLQTLQRLSIAQVLEDATRVEPVDEAPAAIRPLSDEFLGRHVKTIFRLWLVLFGLVGAQMGWVLRPFIGNPNIPFTWFRPRQSNFFEAVLHTLGSLFS